MERLTIDEVIEHCNKTCDMTEKIAKARGHELESIESNQFWEHYQVRAWLKELKQYKYLEEQGLLLRLPCKICDTVWDNYYGNHCAYTITGFSVGTGENYIDEPVSSKEVVYYYSNYSGTITGSFAVSELGKTVFLTQSKAERKLKEMNTDNGIAE